MYKWSLSKELSVWSLGLNKPFYIGQLSSQCINLMVDLNIRMMRLLNFGNNFLIDDPLKLVVDGLYVLSLNVVDSVYFFDS
jgi:hypothetical protein